MRTVYVQPVQPQTDPEAVRKHFAQVGEVLGVRFPAQVEGQPIRSYCFVEFAQSDQATSAVERLHSSLFFGESIQVSIVRPRPRNPRERDDRRGGDGRGGPGGFAPSGPLNPDQVMQMVYQVYGHRGVQALAGVAPVHIGGGMSAPPHGHGMPQAAQPWAQPQHAAAMQPAPYGMHQPQHPGGVPPERRVSYMGPGAPTDLSPRQTGGMSQPPVQYRRQHPTTGYVAQPRFHPYG
jgi:hypothetical protein